jgi:hypothetical protein
MMAVPLAAGSYGVSAQKDVLATIGGTKGAATVAPKASETYVGPILHP